MPIPRTRSEEESCTLLREWLAGRVGADQDVAVRDLSMPHTGYSGETLLFEAAWGRGPEARRERLVARVRTTGFDFFPDVDMSLHYDVLRALDPTDVPAPRPWWFQDADGSPFGEPFFVMSQIAGVVPPEYPPYTVRGLLADADPDEQRAAYDAVLEHLATIHALDWTAMELDFLPAVRSGEPGMATEIRLFQEYADWVLGDRAMPLLDEALTWLKGSIPRSDRLCLNWGDPKLTNVVFDGLKPVGLLDWELATVAPAEVDLAFWLQYHHLITRAQGFASLEGFPSDAEAVARYEQLTGREVQSLDWYLTWQKYKLAVFSTRLSDLLVARGVIEEGSDKAPNAVPMKLLRAALEGHDNDQEDTR